MKKINFCPNPKCINHAINKQNDQNWYIKAGKYHTCTFGPVQRYKCRYCRTKFSDQTFKLDYYAKKKINYELIMYQLVTKSGIRDMARFMKVSTSTISNRISRLSRQAIAMQAKMREHLALEEDLAADGFESFCVSQYFPDNLHILVGQKSQFVYYNDYVTIRRKGRMTQKQKEKRQLLEKQFRSDPRGIEKSFHSLLDEILYLQKNASISRIILYTDQKPDYLRAINKNQGIRDLINLDRFCQIRISSRLVRNLSNPLFPVNYIDRELRKALANHVRETVQFSRNVNDALARLQVVFFHHNFIKIFRINTEIDIKHGEMAGLDRNLIEHEKSRVFRERYFLSHLNLNEAMRKMWLRQYTTPLKEGEEYLPRYAAA